MNMLALLLVVIGAILYVGYKPEHVMPVAQQGVLDARGWNFAKQGVLFLNGKWEYYPSKFIQPSDFAQMKDKPSFVEVPHTGLDWENKSETDPWGYATYRLKIKVNPSNTRMGMLIASVQSSSRVFLNGNLALESGVTGSSRGAYGPWVAPKEKFFRAPNGDITLVIQAANFDYYTTGIVSPIVLGTSQQIAKMTFMSDGMDIATASIIGVLGVYYLFLFFIFKRNHYKKHYLLLLMGVFFLVYSIQIPFEGGEVILKVFPDFPYNIYWKLKMSLVHLATLLLTQYMWWMLYPRKYRHVLLIPAVVFLSYTVATLVLPMHVMAQAVVMLFLAGFGLLNVFGIFIILVIAYVRRDYGRFEINEMRLYILAILTINVVGINDVFYHSVFVDNVVTDIGRIIFAGLMSGVLAFRYYHVFSRMELVTERLQRADRLKDDFLIRTAHELKTPLHGIINITQSLFEAFQTEKLANTSHLRTQQLKLVQLTARRMSGTVNDVMDLARIKEGRLQAKLTDVDLLSCFSFIEDLFSYQVKGKGLQLTHQIHADARWVRADENRLIQVLSNLVDNSIKHTEKGAIFLLAEYKNGSISISVEDTGHGIEPSQQEVLFTPYERRGVEADTDNRGIGLGLSIARELVRIMGGELYLDWSEVDKGSRLICLLPRRDKVDEVFVHHVLEEKVVSGGIPVAGSSNGDRRENMDRPVILAVDDEVLNLEVLSGLFAGQDYSLVTALSGRDALRKISHRKPEIVLLDVMLPDISGYEVCRLLRQSYSMIELPVLFLTVRNTPEDVEYALTVGGNDFIAKPFEAKEIRARVETLLTMKKLAQEVVRNEISFLQAQIKPHFLYNALSTIATLCDSDPDRARDVTSELAHYLRSRFDFGNLEKLVPLKRELEYIQAYINVEKARFGDRLKVDYEISDELDLRIPPLVLQPLVENAVKHGLRDRQEGGLVGISIKKEGVDTVIRVSDNGMGMSDAKMEQITNGSADMGVGLRNVDQRLRKLYGNGLSMTSVIGKGTTAIVVIPGEARR